jgi:hypothetical protein
MSISSKFYYEKSSHHAAYNFNQQSPSLFRNQPRFPFEYYININLNNVSTAQFFISQFFNGPDLEQIMPLVKTVDMPAFKIETAPLNQYNRKRLSQTKIAFEPVKMVFHDVADGKTLKFWEMYYRYYFMDGSEPGKNIDKGRSDYVQSFGGTYYQDGGGAGAGRGSQGEVLANSISSSTNTDGEKQGIQNIVSDTLDNHNFGFNLPTIQNIRNLIQTIDIYQVHGGRFNQVTLVNPRISAFTHDVLSYATSDKTLELTFTWEYEYAFYTIQNMKLGAGEPNNNSTITQFEHGDFLELTNLSFTQYDPDFIETPNQQPDAQFVNRNVDRDNYNLQADIGTVNDAGGGQSTSPFAATDPRRLDISGVRTSSSAIAGSVDISPTPINVQDSPYIQTRPFNSTAVPDTTMYPDMDRAGGG